MTTSGIGQPKKKEFEGLRILLVDDDSGFRTLLQTVLEKLGFIVSPAENGKLASQMVALEEFEVVLSDIRMPEMNGIQLTHFVKSQKKDLPVILMTGFSEIKETEEAYSLGANGFIAKPFKKEDLVEELRKCCRKAAEGGVEAPAVSLELEYCRIPIDDFISGKKIKFNIFIRLSETNFVKIAHEGTDLSLDRIKLFKEKGVHWLYLKKEDFKKYVDFNVVLVPLVRTNSALTREKKLAFFKHANRLVCQSFGFPEFDAELFQSASATLDNTISLMMENDDAFQLLASLADQSDPLYTHSIAVSLYGVLIARECGWTSPVALTKIGLAGLFHDIGLRELDPELIMKPRDRLTPAEVHLFESHTVRGLEILGRMPTVPEEIARVAVQHHEDCVGTGYPNRLGRSRIDPMAKLVAVADGFCLLVWGRDGVRQLEGVEAAKRLGSLYAERFDHEFLSALLRLFKLLPPGERVRASALTRSE